MEYANPNVLVDTQWVEDHLEDINVRIAEVDYDPKANYNLGHIPNSVLFDWKRDINDPLTRNILSRDSLSRRDRAHMARTSAPRRALCAPTRNRHRAA